MNLDQMSRAELEELARLIEEEDRRKRENKLASYCPYPKQREFHALGAHYRERMFSAGNQLGKSMSACMEVAMHLTGRYPDWWDGRVFRTANHWLAGSETAELTRRGVQRLLLGTPQDKLQWGTGAIPKDCIVSTKAQQGVADAVASIVVRHVSGQNSTVQFSSYADGREKWQAETLHGVLLDEEPPEDIYFEAMTRTNVTGGLVIVPFTPLKGITEVVKRFSIERPPSTALVKMSIYECGHYTKEQADAIAASYPEHERKARVFGEPVLGEGAVFPVPEESIIVNPFQIPAYWPQIIGLDFGWDHPAGAVLLAWDRDNDTIYVTRCYRERQATPVVQAAAIKAFGDWIPVAWPHDGHQHDKGSGIQLAQQYRAQGLKMMVEHSKFPDGSIGFEAGISEMLDRMQTGRWKVFRNCDKWLEEFRMYHRENGLVVKEGDDLLSASRVGMMSIRFARVKPQQNRVIQSGGFTPLDPSMGF